MSLKIEVRKRDVSYMSCKEQPFFESNHGADQETEGANAAWDQDH